MKESPAAKPTSNFRIGRKAQAAIKTAESRRLGLRAAAPNPITSQQNQEEEDARAETEEIEKEAARWEGILRPRIEIEALIDPLKQADQALAYKWLRAHDRLCVADTAWTKVMDDELVFQKELMVPGKEHDGADAVRIRISQPTIQINKRRAECSKSLQRARKSLKRATERLLDRTAEVGIPSAAREALIALHQNPMQQEAGRARMEFLSILTALDPRKQWEQQTPASKSNSQEIPRAENGEGRTSPPVVDNTVHAQPMSLADIWSTNPELKEDQKERIRKNLANAGKKRKAAVFKIQTPTGDWINQYSATLVSEIIEADIKKHGK